MKTINHISIIPILLLSAALFFAVTSCEEKKQEHPLEMTSSAEQIAAHIEPTPDIIKPDGGDHLWIFPESKDKLGSGGELQIYIDHTTHTEAAAGFAKYTMGPGGALPVHRHDKTEEIAYILSGDGIVLSYPDGQPVETPISEGYVWYTPPGAWHSFKNTGEEPLALVFAVIPNEKKGLLAFFRKIGAAPGKEAKAPLSPEEFGRIASDHDLILRPSAEDK